MKKHVSILLFVLLVFLLSACGEPTAVPSVEPTSTSLAILITLPTTSPSATAEAIIPTIVPTEEFVTTRVSSIDGMPQVYIPAGTFHMGGYDVRAAPDEFPAHEVTLDAYWMDQLEVTNANQASGLRTENR